MTPSEKLRTLVAGVTKLEKEVAKLRAAVDQATILAVKARQEAQLALAQLKETKE